MKLLVENLADQGDWSSVNGSDPYFPVTNIQDPQTGRVWKSLGADAIETLDLDLGTGYSAMEGLDQHLVIHGHNFDGTWGLALLGSVNGIDWTGLAGGPIDPADYPSGTIDLVIPSTGPTDNYRYWQLLIVKPSAASIAQIGRIYVGTAVDPGTMLNPDYAGLQRARVDPSIVALSPGRQRFGERKTQFDSLGMDFSFIPESAISYLRDIYHAFGRVTPFFIKIQQAEPLERMYYVNFVTDFPERIKGYGDEYYWDIKLGMEQAL